MYREVKCQMSLRRQSLGPVPDCTAAAVKSAYKKGHPYLAFAEAFAELVDYDDFSDMYPNLGQSALHPARLSLALLIGCVEGLSDRQIADRVRDSILWKFLLRLKLGDEGFDHTVLTKFRQRLASREAERLLFDKLLDLTEKKGLLGCDQQRTDSTYILSKARNLNRLEFVFETMRFCLDDLAQEFPQWLFKIADKQWAKRYFEERPFNYKLKDSEHGRDERIQTVGNDGFYLLSKVKEASNKIGELDSVRLLQRVWDEQFILESDDGKPRFRNPQDSARSGRTVLEKTESRVFGIQDPCD